MVLALMCNGTDPVEEREEEEEQELKLLKPRTEAVLGFGYRGETTRDVVGYVDNIPCTTLREPPGSWVTRGVVVVLWAA